MTDLFHQIGLLRKTKMQRKETHGTLPSQISDGKTRRSQHIRDRMDNKTPLQQTGNQ